MLENLFKNMGTVTKNLIIINVLFFVASEFLYTKGIFLQVELGLFYPSSELFRPYQIITHFFMHAGFQHLLLNMLGLFFLGSNLERFWGSKKFLIFYLFTALGAALFDSTIYAFELHNYFGEFFPNIGTGKFSVGASGAIFGLIAAYGLLFPNTEFRLYFLIPVKAKWVAIGSAVWALYNGVNPMLNDNVGHFAHLGGMLFGFILIKIWQKSRNQFY
jgi:membrane associated rhomboid family serine protease